MQITYLTTYTNFLIMQHWLVAAVNVSNDPTVAFTAIIFSLCFMILLKGFIESKPYRKWPIDLFETLFYVNILLLITFTCNSTLMG